MYAERRGEIPTKIQKIRMTIKFVSVANVTVKSFKIASIFDKYHHRLHKYHNAPVLYSAIHHFVTEHYGDVIMGTIASQITSLTIVYSTVYSGADQRKHQSSASLALCGEFTGPGEFPAQMASNAENVSIWWRHHECAHKCTFLLQNDALWDTCQMHCEICERELINLYTLQWRHNERLGLSNHRHHDCLLNRLFRLRWKKSSKLTVTGLCEGNPLVNNGLPSQRARYAENVFIWWRHHVLPLAYGCFLIVRVAWRSLLELL